MPGRHFSTSKLWLSLLLGIVALSTSALHGQAAPKLDIEIIYLPNAYRLKLSTTKGVPLKNDLNLQAIVVRRGYRRVNKLSKPFVIAKGTSSSVVEIPMASHQRNWGYNDTFIIETDQNERFDRDRDYLNQGIQTGYDSSHWQVLFVSSNITSGSGEFNTVTPGRPNSSMTRTVGAKKNAKLPSFKHLEKFYADQNLITAGAVTNDLSLLQALNNASSRITCLPTKDFVEDWKCLLSTSVIMVSATDLATIATSKPKRECLKKWVCAGGNLVVFNAGQSFEKRGTITNLFFPTPVDDDQWSAMTDQFKEFGRFTVPDNLYYGQNIASIDELPNALKRKCSDFKNQKLMVLPVMKGHLFLTNSDMTGAKLAEWQTLYNALLSHDDVADLIGDNCFDGEFQQSFRIPGIGNPPVLAFQLLIGMYVLVIGPGLYFLLNSSGRLHLLLIIVPVFSLLAVLGLFSYGIINDGFSVRGRVQSLTFVDEKLKTAVTHTRQAYYAGVSPRAGIFDEQVFARQSRSNNSSSCRFQFRNDKLMLSGGHIRARSPFQFTSYAIDEIEQGISINNGPTANTKQLVNHYSDRIKYAVVHTKDGWFSTTEIEPGLAGTAIQTDVNSVSGVIRKATNSIKIDSDLRYDYNDQYSIENGQWGISQKLLADLKSITTLKANLPTNSYLLILESNSLVPNPQPNANLGENQLHVLIGKW